MTNFEKYNLQNEATSELPEKAFSFEKEKNNSDIDRAREMRFRECRIVWHQTKEPPRGLTGYYKTKEGVLDPIKREAINSIEIWGKKSGELAWVLAHELAHRFEDFKKMPKEIPDKYANGKLSGVKTVPFDDIKSGRHSIHGDHYYAPMSAVEFQASRRMRHYLESACGLLGISVETAISAPPPEYLKQWYDRGYYYDYHAQIKAKQDVLSKKGKREANYQLKQRKAQVKIKDDLKLTREPDNK